jgi:lipopolysaccharide export LptBFGC system permease protein LptF
MKSKNNYISIAIIIALVFCSTLVFGQNNSAPGKAKSRTVHEEKTVKGKKSTTIDSEEKYDQNGNVIEEKEYKDGKVDKHMLYEYDSNNNKIKETELDASGKPKKTAEYKYVNGVRTEKNTYDETKKLISKKTYTYSY